MKTLHNVFSPLTEDRNRHGCYTPKTARCWRNRQYIPSKCLYLL